MGYYSSPDCFVTNTTPRQPLKWEHPSKRRRMMRLSFPIHFLCSWGVGWSLPGSAVQLGRRLFHLTCPAARAVTDKPRGFALRLKPADGTVVLMGHFGELEAAQGRTEGGSYRVIVAVSRLWNAREKWGEWMNQCHGNKNKEEAVWLRLPGRLFLLFSWISLITNSKMFNRADSLLMLMGSHDFYAIFAHLPRKQMGKTKQKLQFDHVSHSR